MLTERKQTSSSQVAPGQRVIGDRRSSFSIRQKLVGGVIAICVLTVAAVSIAAFVLSANALRTSRIDGFRSTRRLISELVNRFFETNGRAIATEAENQTMRYAIAEFSVAYNRLLDDLAQAGSPINQTTLAKIRAELKAYYQEINRNRADSDSKRALIQSVDDLSPTAVLLQYVYVAKNPAPLGSKSQHNESVSILTNSALDRVFREAFSRTMFARTIDRFQPSFDLVVERNGYEDLILIDSSGNVVFTLKKRLDLGTNVLKGWQADAQLRKGFLGAWYSGGPVSQDGNMNGALATDLDAYPAAADRPVLFFSCLISDYLGARQGVVAHEIAGETITDLINFRGAWQQVGLGETGEAYIIGPDYLPRTETRFSASAPEDRTRPIYGDDFLLKGRTTVLAARDLDLPAISIFSNEAPRSDSAVFQAMNGKRYLALFTPLGLPELNWGLIIQIETREAFAPATHLTLLVIITGLAATVLAIFAAEIFSRVLLGPIQSLVATAEQIGAGNLDVRASVQSSDETSILANRFNLMLDQIQERNRQVRKILETVNEGLFLIGADFVVQEGYSRATARIFRREIVGMKFLDLLCPNTDSPLQPLVSQAVLHATSEYLNLLLNPKIRDKLIEQTNPLQEVEYDEKLPNGRVRKRYLEFRFNRVLGAETIAQIMVTVHDISQRITLQRQIKDNERRAKTEMEMLFAMLHVEPGVLSGFLDHTTSQLSEITKALEAEQFGSREGETTIQRVARYDRLLQRIARSIHLIKGDAAMIRLKYFEELASQVEEHIEKLRGETVTGEQFLPITTALATMLDQADMTRDLIDRLLAMKEVLAKSPAASVAESLQEFTQDVAHRTGKQVNLSLDIDSELTRMPIDFRESVQTMLTQLVRNAVIHGIETPPERQKAGKPVVGNVVVSSMHEAGNVIFRVRDDGCGLQRAVLEKRAVDLGYVARTEISNWTDQQVIDLVFASKFTTMDHPTVDAGRGVGLGAVRDLATRLGGQITVTGKPRVYTEFRLEIPLQ